MKYSITNPESELKVAVVELVGGEAGATWNVSTFDEKGKESGKHVFAGAEVSVERGVAIVRLSDGTRHILPVASAGSDGSVVIATALGNIRLLPARGVPLEGAGGAGGAHRQIKSSMPGKVLKILCKTGDKIEAGQPILIIEAMKMENEIRAKHAGVVEEIPVQPGQKVETGEVLVKFGAGE